jgi:MerC mercury resistance protein
MESRTNGEMIDLPRGPVGILDTFGTAASLLCAVHCAVTPVAMASLPLLGLEFIGAEATEYALVGLSIVVGSVSLVLGYRRHRSVPTLAVFSCGLTLLVLGRVTETRGVEGAGVVSAVAGGCIVATAHIINRRLCRNCALCRQTEDVIDRSTG